MRKWKLVCVPMILLLLCGCNAKETGNEAENLALAIRGEFLAMQSWRAECTVTADYGQRVYDFGMTVEGGEAGAQLALTAPEEVAGLSVQMTDGASRLATQGMVVETGDLGGDLSPVTAVPVLVEAAKSAFMDVCILEEGETPALRVLCRDPELAVGQGEEISLWFDPDSHTLLRGEISLDGYRVIDCVFTRFTGEGPAAE